MHKFIQTVFLLIAFTSPTSAQDFGYDAVRTSCQFMSLLEESKTKAAIFLEPKFTQTADVVTREIIEKFAPLPGRFDQVWGLEVANVKGLVIEHFIVAGSNAYGTSYFRLVYERKGARSSLITLNLNTNYHQSLNMAPLLQAPVDLKCPAHL